MFDFQKAINGEPIYCNGERVYPIYSPTRKDWSFESLTLNLNYWDKDGKATKAKNYGDLSTDPPKRKVKVTAYVYTDLMGIPYVSSQKPNRVPHNFIEEKQFEVEI